MRFLNAETGALSFPDGYHVLPGMPAKALNDRFQTPAENDLTLCLKARDIDGGSVALICVVSPDGLKCVTLTPCAVAGRADAGADRQRAFLFAALGLKDPCPDTRRVVRVRCAFGTVTLSTDPYTGAAAARLDYNISK